MLDASASDKKGMKFLSCFLFTKYVKNLPEKCNNIWNTFSGTSTVATDDSDSECSENEIQITERIQQYSEEDTNQ